MKSILFIIVLLISLNINADELIKVISSPLSIDDLDFSTLDSKVYSSSSLNEDLVEVLDKNSSLVVSRSGGHGQQTSFYLRGSSNGEFKVYIDDVDISDVSTIGNSSFLEHYSSSLAQNIFISKKPSLSKSLNSSAGFINIETGADNTKEKYLLSSQFSSFNTKSLSLSGIKKWNDNSTFIGVSLKSSDGFSAAKNGQENDSYQRYNVLLSNSLKAKSGEYKVFLLKANGKSEIDDWGSDLVDNDLSRFDQNLISLSYKNNFCDGLWWPEFSVSKNSINRIYPSEYYESEKDNFKFQNKFIFEKYQMFLRAQSSINKSISNKIKTHELYAGANLNVGKNDFSVGYGIFNSSVYKTIHNYEFIFQRSLDFLQSAFEISIIQTTKEPSLYQLFDPKYGNESLEASEVLNYNISYSFLNGKSVISLFEKRILEDFVFFNNTYENLGEVKYQGLELDQVFEISKKQKIILGYSNIYMKKLSSKGVYYQKPRENMRLNYQWGLSERINLDVKYTYTSKTINTRTLPSYSLFDFSLEYNKNKDLKFYTKIENIFDKKYEQVSGYNTFPRTYKIGIVSQL